MKKKTFKSLLGLLRKCMARESLEQIKKGLDSKRLEKFKLKVSD